MHTKWFYVSYMYTIYISTINIRWQMQRKKCVLCIKKRSTMTKMRVCAQYTLITRGHISVDDNVAYPICMCACFCVCSMFIEIVKFSFDCFMWHFAEFIYIQSIWNISRTTGGADERAHVFHIMIIKLNISYLEWIRNVCVFISRFNNYIHFMYVISIQTPTFNFCWFLSFFHFTNLQQELRHITIAAQAIQQMHTRIYVSAASLEEFRIWESETTWKVMKWSTTVRPNFNSRASAHREEYACPLVIYLVSEFHIHRYGLVCQVAYLSIGPQYCLRPMLRACSKKKEKEKRKTEQKIQIYSRKKKNIILIVRFD